MFGIGIYAPKIECNIGTLWRSAYIYNADFIFTIGARYKKQSSDTCKAYRKIPLFNFEDFEDFRQHIPYDCKPVYIDNYENSVSCDVFKHPKSAVYILGAEDYGIPQKILDGNKVVKIDTPVECCLNVSTAGTLILDSRYRYIKKIKE